MYSYFSTHEHTLPAIAQHTSLRTHGSFFLCVPLVWSMRWIQSIHNSRWCHSRHYERHPGALHSLLTFCSALYCERLHKWYETAIDMKTFPPYMQISRTQWILIKYGTLSKDDFTHLTDGPRRWSLDPTVGSEPVLTPVDETDRHEVGHEWRE